MQDPYRPPGAHGAYGYRNNPAIPNQSGLGIASFIIAVVSIIITVAVFVSILSEVSAARYSGYGPSRYTSFAMIGLAVIGVLVIALIGLILGIVALTQPHRQRALSILGTILNGLIIFGFIVLMIIGQMR